MFAIRESASLKHWSNEEWALWMSDNWPPWLRASCVMMTDWLPWSCAAKQRRMHQNFGPGTAIGSGTHGRSVCHRKKNRDTTRRQRGRLRAAVLPATALGASLGPAERKWGRGQMLAAAPRPNAWNRFLGRARPSATLPILPPHGLITGGWQMSSASPEGFLSFLSHRGRWAREPWWQGRDGWHFLRQWRSVAYAAVFLHSTCHGNIHWQGFPFF